MATSSSSKTPVQAFEFTKRKRWTETLFSELSETIVFVLSPTCKVLFCSAAIVALLGWKEDQLVDIDLSTFIEEEDQENFRWSFTESLRTGQEMFTYVRFKLEQHVPADANGKTGQLFELKGHPHLLEGHSEPQCLFLTAMPYPSRNIATLNSFLDSRIEHERLVRRLEELRKAEASSQSVEPHPPSSPTPHPPQFSGTPNASGSSYTGSPYYPSPDQFAINQPSSHSDIPTKSEGNLLPSSDTLTALGVEDNENAHRRKKAKKLLVGDEQRVCVTCGRTDSPEWRKGPLGPKTLCNACGLRWAKRSRKPESEDYPVPSFKGQDPGADDGPSNFPLFSN